MKPGPGDHFGRKGKESWCGQLDMATHTGQAAATWTPAAGCYGFRTARPRTDGARSRWRTYCGPCCESVPRRAAMTRTRGYLRTIAAGCCATSSGSVVIDEAALVAESTILVEVIMLTLDARDYAWLSPR